MKSARKLVNAIGEALMASAFAGGNPPEIEVEKLIERIQADARKDGLMTALNIVSETIRAESPKYAGLQYVVTSAILKEADALDIL